MTANTCSQSTLLWLSVDSEHQYCALIWSDSTSNWSAHTDTVIVSATRPYYASVKHGRCHKDCNTLGGLASEQSRDSTVRSLYYSCYHQLSHIASYDLSLVDICKLTARILKCLLLSMPINSQVRSQHSIVCKHTHRSLGCSCHVLAQLIFFKRLLCLWCANFS